ncbi:hypothetical protein [Grimontia sp. NTOU-MAR1]|uniref:hypothetical protein n=1 Tax=Grimontia sp. NTOU-MAR1 TaxID=3111011 RepID=UPI002DBCFD57|nr:hypothetical protein [Grimontia sp. NTOU-MAR1]WRV97752.1 hypothetical protein VP504_17240 [Grimontia sp. NTOU-MAR1]
MKSAVLGAALALTALPLSAFEHFEAEGEISFQQRQFAETGLLGQSKSQTSVAIEPELYWETEEGNSSFVFSPFLRWDSMDDDRTHGDVREALWRHYDSNYEIRAGVGIVFWGVTESQHLVDVINQTDAVEAIDGEVKLGQPMVSIGWEFDDSLLDLYLLPYFRERTFASNDGRLAFPGLGDTEAQYESRHEEWYPDVAGRYSLMWDQWDFGVSAFHGTNRDPYFVQGLSKSVEPYYALMSQFGLDVQAIFGDWLWKAEAIRRFSLDNHTAFTGGFEYTYVGVNGGMTDLGFLVEYLYDNRGEKAPVAGQNDVFAGLRWVLNDLDGTEFLVGGTVDLDNSDSVTMRLESSGRFSNDWSWTVTGWMFDSDTPSDPVYSLRKDDFLEAEISWYF